MKRSIWVSALIIGSCLAKAQAYTPLDIKGTSLYFIFADSFGGPPVEQGLIPCSTTRGSADFQGWCNGTIKGITNQLDYIQGMGFEGIWITPVIKQFYGPDPDGRSGYGSSGYWAYNWNEIDPNFGTEADLVELSAELHSRGMVFVYDIVLNHVGPIHSTADLEQIVPFNKEEYFHTRGIGSMTFDQYAQGFARGGTRVPPPVQGIGPGAMCIEGPDGCNNYHCPVETGFGDPCPVDPTYLGADAPGPPDIPYCGVGDFVCPGYNEEQTIEGWFASLGDLNHSHPFVHDELLRWGKRLLETYHIDAFRLDTAPYVSKSFLSNFQAEVVVPILGEVTTGSWSFFKSFANKQDGPLKGLLNFYLQNVATPGFCGSFYPGAQLNLSHLGANIEVMLNSGEVDLDLTGNFVDNHDMPRLAVSCNDDMPRMKNAIAWTMLNKGIPMIYYGTELFLKDIRQSFWQYGYDTTTAGYQFIKTLNSVRKKYAVGISSMSLKHASPESLVFTRGGDAHMWIYLTNANASSAAAVALPGPEDVPGHIWVDALNDEEPASVSNGVFMLRASTGPKALVLKKLQEEVPAPEATESSTTRQLEQQHQRFRGILSIQVVSIIVTCLIAMGLLALAALLAWRCSGRQQARCYEHTALIQP